MNVQVENALLAQSESLLAARHLPEAVTRFKKANAGGADADRCAAGLWMAYMLSGQFESAWQQSDAIRRRGAPDPNRLWRGEPLAGKRVILRCLHGFGDAVQFLRYAPHLRALVSHLTVEVPPRFLDIARCFDGVGEVITWHALAPTKPPEWDVQIEVMELPYIFRTQLDELPLATKYLHSPKSPVSQAVQPGRLRVGLAWNAGSWNPARSIGPEALRPLLAVQGCEFWSLEGGPRPARTRPSTLSMHDDAECRDSLVGLAATIAQLDLVITVDTLAAHLSGALGVNAWVLLQYEADWRWMHDRNCSPWYPSLKLFRQPVPGDWESVIASVGHALQAEVNRHKDKADPG